MPIRVVVFECGAFVPLTGARRERWDSLLTTLEGALDGEVQAAVIAGELLGILAGQQATFEALLRDVGPCYEHYSFRVTAGGMSYRREWAEQMSESWQSSDRTVDTRWWCGIPSSVVLSVDNQDGMSSTWTVRLGGVPPETEKEVETALLGLFGSVKRRDESAS